MSDYPWPVHPAAQLFPELDGERLRDLADDIAKNGLHEPVWLYQDSELGVCLLDGRNRVRACEQAAVPVETRTYEGTDPIGFAVSMNLKRRHLTVPEAAFAAAKVKPMYEAQAKAEQTRAGAEYGRGHPKVPLHGGEPIEPGSPHAGEAATRAGAVFGVSRASVNRAERIQREAPDLIEPVLAGKISLNAAGRAISERQSTRTESPPSAPEVPQPSLPKGGAVNVRRREERVRTMAAAGYTSRQIAPEIGVKEGTVKDIAARIGVEITADKVVGKVQRHDHNRIVAEATITLEGTVMAVGLVDVSALDPEQAKHWAASLAESLRSLNRFAKQIREVAA